MKWYEKINRLDTLEVFFKEYLSNEVIKNIQYISIRKKYRTWILLVGVNNLEYKNQILSYSPQIVKNICKYMQKSGNDIEKKLIPKKMEIFKYDLEEKAKKEKKEMNWALDPESFFIKTTDKPNGMYKNINGEYYIVRKSYIYPLIKEDKKGFVRYAHYMAVYNNQYDFIAEDRYGKSWKYIKIDKKYFKYPSKLRDDIKIYYSSKIGFLEIECDSNFPTEFRETTRQTYLKWKEKAKEQSLLAQQNITIIYDPPDV